MVQLAEINEVTLLFESLTDESKNLIDTFSNIGVKVNAVCIEDDGFLPRGVVSPFGYFMGDFPENGKPVYFNQVPIPPFWEISGNGSQGKICDLTTEHATMYYTKTDNTRLVKIVDWTGLNGKTRVSEHYNQQGCIFCRTLFNVNGQKYARTFYSAEGKEVVYENFVTGDFLVNWNGKDYILKDKTEFVKFFFKCTGLDETNIIFNSLSHPFFVSESLPQNGHTDVLFWNEPIYDELPGNMKGILNGTATRAKKIYVQRHEAYQKMMGLGASPDIVKELGYVYDFARDNEYRANALILTNSDEIERLTEIVEGAPEIRFYIAALTEMSAKLMSMDRYSNVTLFPGVKRHLIASLYEKCDLYLDINHQNEIVDAVHRAFLNNMVILGFENTVHNRNYISPTNIFPPDKWDIFITALKMMSGNENMIDAALDMQMDYALAADAEDYDMNSIFL